tara:strand:+ start:169 stop:471 length:303 start_codon:yes stop_codon:yes gene_type:complete
MGLLRSLSSPMNEYVHLTLCIIDDDEGDEDDEDDKDDEDNEDDEDDGDEEDANAADNSASKVFNLSPSMTRFMLRLITSSMFHHLFPDNSHFEMHISSVS